MARPIVGAKAHRENTRGEKCSYAPGTEQGLFAGLVAARLNLLQEDNEQPKMTAKLARKSEFFFTD
jgi:hypothetical protein